MREILFRGKARVNGEWVYGDLIHEYRGRERGIYQNGPEIVYPLLPKTEGQYTGLIDKNGKKIFEGDIIKFGKSLGAVNYDEGCFCVKPNKPYWRRLSNPAIDIVMNEYPNEIEVIGNIHDNPELLEATT